MTIRSEPPFPAHRTSEWIPAIDESGPVYLAITRALETDIGQGRLRVGDRLPPQRDLAAELGVNVGTITRAYGEARRRGLIEGEVGRGTFVRAPSQSALARVEPESESGPIDLSINVPTAMPSPNLAQALERLVTKDHDSPGLLEDAMAYRDPAGSPALRLAGVRWFERLGIAIEAEDLVVCAGAQHAILIALGTIAGPGDLVLGEALTYPGFLAAARLLGLRVKGVELDAMGIIPESLEEICRTEKPRLLYCMPSLQNPTCAQLPQDRREQIAEIAARHDLMIVQDEIHGGLVDDAASSLARLAPDHVMTIASLSKTLSPGIRTAFLAAPRERVSRMTELIWSSIWMSSPLGCELALGWLEDDTADRVLSARLREIEARQAIAQWVLADFDVATQPTAYHLWLTLPSSWESTTATAALAEAGIKVSSADEFRVEDTPTVQAIRISLSATRDRERLEIGLQTIARVLGQPPTRTPFV